MNNPITPADTDTAADVTGATEHTVLDGPLSPAALAAAADDDGWVSGVVRIDLGDLIDTDLDGALDLFSEALTDSPLLMQVTYAVVGHADGDVLHVRVSGDASQILSDDDGEDL